MSKEEVLQYIIEEIKCLQKEKEQVCIAIDGRCASGKTTLANHLQALLGCEVIHIDSFFLRPKQRTKERYEMPGGNVDYERLQEEVFLPLKAGRSFSYRPFECSTQQLGDPIMVKAPSVVILEGSYSCHPVLWEQYDLHIFLTVSKEEQIVRLIKRDASKLQAFQEKWIPLEEAYFSFYNIEERCELVLWQYENRIEKGHGEK